MSYEYFFHYTTKDGAKRIVLSGKISPSLAANGNATHGDGVYLTTVDPRLGKETVGNNNWDGIKRVSSEKMERYFEIRIPSSKVRRARVKRDIQVSNIEIDFKMNLKNMKLALSNPGLLWW